MNGLDSGSLLMLLVLLLAIQKAAVLILTMTADVVMTMTMRMAPMTMRALTEVTLVGAMTTTTTTTATIVMTMAVAVVVKQMGPPTEALAHSEDQSVLFVSLAPHLSPDPHHAVSMRWRRLQQHTAHCGVKHECWSAGVKFRGAKSLFRNHTVLVRGVKSLDRVVPAFVPVVTRRHTQRGCK
jgi:hypothetical protein